jgi:hypothetical protein
MNFLILRKVIYLPEGTGSVCGRPDRGGSPVILAAGGVVGPVPGDRLPAEIVLVKNPPGAACRDPAHQVAVAAGRAGSITGCS